MNWSSTFRVQKEELNIKLLLDTRTNEYILTDVNGNFRVISRDKQYVERAFTRALRNIKKYIIKSY